MAALLDPDQPSRRRRPSTRGELVVRLTAVTSADRVRGTTQTAVVQNRGGAAGVTVSRPQAITRPATAIRGARRSVSR